MRRSLFVWIGGAALLAMAAMVAAFWTWALVSEWLSLGTRGVGGSVTAVLWNLYLFGVPASGAVALVAGLIVAVGRRSWRAVAVFGAVVAATTLFWLWSMISAGL